MCQRCELIAFSLLLDRSCGNNINLRVRSFNKQYNDNDYLRAKPWHKLVLMFVIRSFAAESKTFERISKTVSTDEEI